MNILITSRITIGIGVVVFDLVPDYAVLVVNFGGVIGYNDKI